CGAGLDDLAGRVRSPCLSAAVLRRSHRGRLPAGSDAAASCVTCGRAVRIPGRRDRKEATMSAQGFVGATLGALLMTGSAALAERAPDSYILSEGEATFCTSASVKDVLAVQGRIAGRFLWARRAGREYLVRESGTLDQALSLFAPLRLDEP